jgi:hypothetical protein
MGFDYIHTAVEDHSRLGYSEIRPGSKAAICMARTLMRRGDFPRPQHHPHRTSPHRQCPTTRGNAATAASTRLGPTCVPTPTTTNAPRPSEAGFPIASDFVAVLWGERHCRHPAPPDRCTPALVPGTRAGSAGGLASREGTRVLALRPADGGRRRRDHGSPSGCPSPVSPVGDDR